MFNLIQYLWHNANTIEQREERDVGNNAVCAQVIF